jgi:predicted nucleic acid-binding protein
MWEGLRGQTVYLDANVIIYAIEAGNRWQSKLRQLFEMIDGGLVFAVTSELTLAEVLARPLSQGATDLVDKFELALDPARSPIEIPSVSRTILRSAAELQGNLEIKLMDVIHIATAQAAGCQSLVTNDFRLGRKLRQPTRISIDQG